MSISAIDVDALSGILDLADIPVENIELFLMDPAIDSPVCNQYTGILGVHQYPCDIGHHPHGDQIGQHQDGNLIHEDSSEEKGKNADNQIQKDSVSPADRSGKFNGFSGFFLLFKLMEQFLLFSCHKRPPFPLCVKVQLPVKTATLEK